MQFAYLPSLGSMRRNATRRRAGLGPAAFHQYPHRRHQRRVLPDGRGTLANLRQGIAGFEVLGAGDQSVGGKPEPAAGRSW